MKNWWEKSKKYLPSKKFTKIMGVILILLFIIFILFYFFSNKVSFVSNTATDSLSLQGRTFGDLINKDTDGDGVFDWKENLWGTDMNNKATFNDIPDGTYIAEKRKELNLEIEDKNKEESLTETEKFAREFFTTYTAMKSSGDIDSETINNFSTTLGQSIVESELSDAYAEKDVLIKNTDTPLSRKEYYQSLQDIFNKHKNEAGLGNELSIVSSALTKSGGTGGKPEDYAELLVIGEGYKSFTKEMMTLKVPSSLLEYHLKIANSANNTGQGVLNLQKIVDDPIVGIAGLAQYKKNSADLLITVATLEELLAKEQ